MGFNQIVKAFIPQDKVFYSIFENIVQNLKKMADIYERAFKHPNIAERNEMLRSLEKLEHTNDELTHNIFVELGKNFITPFDREDIHYLATALDDIADYIHSSSKKIVNYNVTVIDEYMIDMLHCITEAVAVLADAVVELRSLKNLKQITTACIEINRIEGKADDIFDKAIINLFDSNIPTLEVVKLKDIYEEMEIVTDKCEDASNVIESIIIKYA